MKKEYVGKRIVSVLLVLTMLFGMTGIGENTWVAKAEETEYTTPDTSKELRDELEGYTRITLTDFQGSSSNRMTEEKTFVNSQKIYYVGNYAGKTYLDVDVNFHGSVANGKTVLQYQSFSGEASKNSFGVCWNEEKLSFLSYDLEKNVTTLATIVGADYGASSAEYFNIKLLTNIKTENEIQKVTYQLWINDWFVYEGTLSQQSYQREGLRVVDTSDAKQGISIRNALKSSKKIEDEFGGYTSVSVNDYATAGTTTYNTFSSGIAGTVVTNSEKTYYKGSANNTLINADGYSLDGKYLDLDINTNNGTSFHHYLLNDTSGIKDRVTLNWTKDSNVVTLTQYKDTQAVSGKKLTADLKAYGRENHTDFFNIKLRIDAKANASDNSKVDVTIQWWINNQYAGALECEGTRMGNGFCEGAGNYVREPKYLERELVDYDRISVNDYAIAGTTTYNTFSSGIAGTVVTNSEKTYYKGSANNTLINADGYSLDGKYLDLDINTNNGTSFHHYLLNDTSGIKDRVTLNWTKDSNVVTLTQYKDTQAVSGKKLTADLKAYGRENHTDFFNIKLRIDAKANASDNSKVDVTIQWWINNQYVGILKCEATRMGNGFCEGAGNYVRDSKDITDELSGYDRITVEDFDGLVAARTIAGTQYPSAKAGVLAKNRTEPLDRTYLDIDVDVYQDSSTDRIFFTYLMTPNSNDTSYFYGDEQNRYQFEMTKGSTIMKIRSVIGGKAASGTAVRQLDLANCGYTDGDIFNLKIRTDIDTDSTHTKRYITLQIWVNNQYLGVAHYTESTSRDMTAIGIRGKSEELPTTVRTPMNQATLQDESYDLAKLPDNGGYLLSGADTFYVNGTLNQAGTILQEPGDYIVERILDGEVVSTQCISLYHVGDVDLNGNAFDSNKDANAIQGILDYGTPVKAARKAADVNNDGEVTAADKDLLKSSSSVSSDYYVPSLTYDYLGGNSVMPISGFYGPYSNANLTSAVYEAIADSGINLITYSPIEYSSGATFLQQSLALAEKYGIGVFVTDTGLNTIIKDEDENVTEQTVLTNPTDIAKQMEGYSVYDSFLGVNIVDEPKSSYDESNDLFKDLSATHYKRYQYYEDITQSLLPYANVTGYVNLHGSQAMDAGKYSTYVKNIEKDVDVLSFDSYLYFEEGSATQALRVATYLESLDLIRQTAKDSNKPFWSYVQAGSDYRDDKNNSASTYHYTKEDTLWIVNTSLAFGAKGIQYFPLLQPEYFSYDNTSENGHDYDRNGIIGADNEKNQNYEFVKAANTQIQAIDEVLMKSNNKGVIVTGDAYAAIYIAKNLRDYEFTGIIKKSNNTYTTKLKDISDDKDVMVGCFDYRGSEAFYVVNYDRTENASQTITLTFNGSQQYRLIQEAKTTYGQGDSVELTIPSGAGVLVVLEDHIVEYTAAEFATYRTGETFTAPEAPVGYVFAGWFTNKDCKNAVPMNAKTVSIESVYAKFVDENLLNVKAQILANTTIYSETTDIRFVSAVDSLSYSKIGFLIKQGDKVRDRSNNKVYATLSAYDEYGKTQSQFTPQNVFCETATRFKTWTITGVPNTSFETPFEVTAYWITKDGTKVCSPQATKIIFDAIQ